MTTGHESGSMSEVVPNLWLGDLQNALDTEGLRQRNIHSILTAMRGTVKVAQTFKKLQIDLDDTNEEDILKHLVTCVTFIQAELDKNRGVLVHCVAGISRSASIVAAYLMYSRGLNLQDALSLIREARPEIDPNTNFVNQLKIFHKASFSVSKQDKTIRMYYLERLVTGFKSGNVTLDENTFISYSPPSTSSTSTAPEANHRRIRCKMCRQELATREHMLDHGQLSPPTPAVSYSPVITPSISLAGPSRATDDHESLNPAEVEEAAVLGQSLSRKLSENVEPSLSTPQAAAIKPSGLVHASQLSAQLASNPQIAALRSGLSVVPAPSPSLINVRSSPILANPKCSGYFVEPLKWMDSILEQGQMSGKITCPNKKCGSKLGNYDWAGVCCSCKEWVVPGFCIHRSKVDEIA